MEAIFAPIADFNLKGRILWIYPWGLHKIRNFI